jgi:hypothetical protein
MNMVSAGSQEYIIMQKKIEFEIPIQIHRNRTCRCRLLYIMECAKLYKKKDLWC